jgi:hypothetical protein
MRPVFECKNTHAPNVGVECPSGRSGTRRTTRKRKSPAESGPVLRTVGSDGPHENGVLVEVVETVSARFGTETGSSHLNK